MYPPAPCLAIVLSNQHFRSDRNGLGPNYNTVSSRRQLILAWTKKEIFLRAQSIRHRV